MFEVKTGQDYGWFTWMYHSSEKNDINFSFRKTCQISTPRTWYNQNEEFSGDFRGMPWFSSLILLFSLHFAFNNNHRGPRWQLSVPHSVPRHLIVKGVCDVNTVPIISSVKFSHSVRVPLFAITWTAARQASLSITNSPTPGVYANPNPWVCDAIKASHPLSSPSPPSFNLSQHQGLFKRVSSSHQVAKVLEFQLQHQSFQWIFRKDFL